MIRVKTLRELKATRRYVFRVRWRACVPGKPWVCDADGDDNDPLTWARWEEEYFIQLRTAERRVATDFLTRDKVRPRGLIDQVRASLVWGRWELEAQWNQGTMDLLSDYDRGRNRLVGHLMGSPGLIACDQR